MPTNFKRRMDANFKHLMAGVPSAPKKAKAPVPQSRLVMENYNEELEKTVARMNAEGKADQVVQFLRYYEDHDSLCRTGHWTTVVLRVPA